MSSPLSTLPSVDAVTRRPAAEALRELYGRPALVAAVRLAVAEARARLGAGGRSLPADPGGVILAAAAEILVQQDQPAVRPVFNLTGTVLHTNLGRASLPETAIEAVRHAAQGPSSLEYDLETGRRGERERGVEARLCRLTGAEAATFVNNNAAAVLLTLNGLALRREVPVSRGELIEIGGAFRMPDIMARAGCRLREVGTTNRTRLGDYAEAIGPRTALLMKVHPSNYVISGFTEQVPERALAGLARDRGLPLVTDLGSGALVDLACYGLPSEPTPSAVLTDGADLVTFSGDKLLGGPQAGLIVGRRDLVEKLRRNPLKRALRLDKMTLAALDAVLRLYENQDRLRERLPALRLLTRPVEEIAAQAERLAGAVSAVLPSGWSVEPVPCDSEIGSGALPGAGLPSAGLALRFDGRGGGRRLKALAAALRALPRPVIGRTVEQTLRLDLRCLEDEDAFCDQLVHLNVESKPETKA